MNRIEAEKTRAVVQPTLKKRFTAISYNIHKCVGLDGKQKPERVAQVIRKLQSPLVGLQEVDSLVTNGSQTDYLARETGLTPIAGPAIRKGKGYYGNVLLTKFPILETRCLDISVDGSEPRSLIDAILNVYGISVRVVVTHLGLIPWERRRQVKRLLKILSDGNDEKLVVLGDINEWLPISPRLRALHRRFGKTPGPPTFPSFLPIIALDRIWVKPRNALLSMRVHKSKLARLASDHLPVLADIALPGR